MKEKEDFMHIRKYMYLREKKIYVKYEILKI